MVKWRIYKGLDEFCVVDHVESLGEVNRHGDSAVRGVSGLNPRLFFVLEGGEQ